MGQGTIRASASVILGAITDSIDLDVLRRRLLLPEQYTLTSLHVCDDSTRSEADISVFSPDIPDGAWVSMRYQMEPLKTIELWQSIAKLQSVDVEPGEQGAQ